MEKVIVERREERWHVGKEIPLVLIFAILSQTVAGVWWAATQSAKLDNLTSMVEIFRASQYTQADSRRDAELFESKLSDINRRIDVLEKRQR